MRNKIINSAFIISCVSYLFFLFCEYLRPGFVSFVFSVHLILIPILVFGYLVALEQGEQKENRILGIFISIIIGLILMIIVWKEGEVFGDMRIFMAIIGLLLPFLINRVNDN